MNEWNEKIERLNKLLPAHMQLSIYEENGDCFLFQWPGVVTEELYNSVVSTDADGWETNFYEDPESVGYSLLGVDAYKEHTIESALWEVAYWLL